MRQVAEEFVEHLAPVRVEESNLVLQTLLEGFPQGDVPSGIGAEVLQERVAVVQGVSAIANVALFER